MKRAKTVLMVEVPLLCAFKSIKIVLWIFMTPQMQFRMNLNLETMIKRVVEGMKIKRKPAMITVMIGIHQIAKRCH